MPGTAEGVVGAAAARPPPGCYFWTVRLVLPLLFAMPVDPV
jgi:hypothetical protein